MKHIEEGLNLDITQPWEPPQLLRLPFKETLDGKTRNTTEFTDGTMS